MLSNSSLEIPQRYKNTRLDKALAQLFPAYSRAVLQKLMKAGGLYLDDQPVLNPKTKCQGGEKVYLNLEKMHQPSHTMAWAACPIEHFQDFIHYEDESLIVFNKPVGLSVHPGTGNWHHTLANGILHARPFLKTLPRAGIVYRLDKNTSGLLVVAKTWPVHASLIRQLQQKSILREYDALVNGIMITGGTIDAPLARHPVYRQKRAVISSGKPAVTHYRILRRFRRHTLIRARLETGRTHQIRVHIAHQGFPIVGDKLYGARPFLPPRADEQLKAVLQAWSTQALHAKKLIFNHPLYGKPMHFEVPLPDKLMALLAFLAEDQQRYGKEAW